MFIIFQLSDAVHDSSKNGSFLSKFSGPVQSSHYEDSSDDDCDFKEAQASGPSSGFRRQCSNVESGISTSGQVDEGQFRLVPNPTGKAIIHHFTVKLESGVLPIVVQ